MSDDILETLKCGRPEYNEETRNYETVITKNERLAIKEITRLREENARLREATERLIRSISASWSAFERGLREEIGNTNYVCVREKIDAAAAALKETGDE